MEKDSQDSFEGVSHTLLPGLLLCIVGDSRYQGGCGGMQLILLDAVFCLVEVGGGRGSLLVGCSPTSAFLPHFQVGPRPLQPSYTFHFLSARLGLNELASQEVANNFRMSNPKDSTVCTTRWSRNSINFSQPLFDLTS